MGGLSSLWGGLENPLETMSTGTELSLKGAWDKAPTVKEICKLGDIAYFGKLSKLGEKKTLLRLSNSWSNIRRYF